MVIGRETGQSARCIGIETDECAELCGQEMGPVRRLCFFSFSDGTILLMAWEKFEA